ncbi:hypothetical protein BC832DRAFT_538219 [Gaertneriomyces semiglobifer]|nr:hypothetical protein BC832DRAFT_538219 [Gaertneriomyces semiglobifer]
MSKVEPMDVSPRDDQESPSRVLHRSPEPLGGDSGRRLRDHSKKSSIDMLIDGNSGPDSERTGDGYADGSPLKRNRVEPESALVADQQGGSSGQGSPTDEQPARPKQRKRLSINTSVGPNHPGRASAPVGGTGPTSASVNADVMEQMRNTLKLKQQQQAIIEARQSAQIMNRGPMSAEPRGLGGRGAQSASLDPPHLPLHPFRNRGGSPSGVHSSPRQGSTRSSGKGSARVPESSRFSHLSSTSGQPVASPITQFPSRELPLPPHLQTERYSTHAAGGEHDGPRSPHPALTSLHSSKQNLPPPSPATAYPMHHVAPNVPLSRSAFLSFAEHFYDIHEESTRLVATLRDQIRRSTAMLQTLQASGQMIEGLVRSHFREMQVGYGERFGAALTDLNRRLSTLEERSGISSEAGTNAGVNWGFRGAPPSATPGGAAAAGFPIRDRDGQDAGDSRSVNGDRLAQDTIKVLLERVERLESAAKPSQKNRASSSEGEGEEE